MKKKSHLKQTAYSESAFFENHNYAISGHFSANFSSYCETSKFVVFHGNVLKLASLEVKLTVGIEMSEY